MFKFVSFFLWLNSSAGPSSNHDQSCNHTQLQRLVAPTLNGNVPDLKGLMGDSCEKKGSCARPATSRKRVRNAADVETAHKGSSSSATNGLNGELEIRQGTHEDHCYSLQPTGSQTNIEEWPHAKRKAPKCVELAADRAQLQVPPCAQKWQRWEDFGLEFTNILCVWPSWDISVSQKLTVDFQEIPSVRGLPSHSLTGEAAMAVGSLVTNFWTLLLKE